MAGTPVHPQRGVLECARDDRLCRAGKKLHFWIRVTAALLIFCVVEALILVACGLIELVQSAPHLQQYQEIFPEEDPTRLASLMISVGGVSSLVLGIPAVGAFLTVYFATKFARSAELQHLIGFVRWFRRSLIAVVLLLTLYLLFVAVYALYMNFGIGP